MTTTILHEACLRFSSEHHQQVFEHNNIKGQPHKFSGQIITAKHDFIYQAANHITSKINLSAVVKLNVL